MPLLNISLYSHTQTTKHINVKVTNLESTCLHYSFQKVDFVNYGEYFTCWTFISDKRPVRDKAPFATILTVKGVR